MHSSKTPLTKEAFKKALSNIDSFMLSYYENGIRVHLTDEVFRSIEMVKRSVNSLLNITEEELNWASSTIAQLKRMNAERMVDFGQDDVKVREILTDISISINDQRRLYKGVFTD